MKTRFLAALFLLVPVQAALAAENSQLGFASTAEVAAEPDGRFRFDECVLTAKALREQIVLLDEQLHVDRLDLRRGSADITAQQLADMAVIARSIHAQLFAEQAGGGMTPVTIEAAPSP